MSFARTPIMSSYLLAFVVGEFDYVEEKDANGVVIRVYTPVGKANLGQFALDVSIKPSSVRACLLLLTIASREDAAILHRILWSCLSPT